MSIVCLSHVMRHSEATLGARLVLFVLAEHAHDDGTEAYPSVETLAERTRMSRRGVQSALRRLEADEMIVRLGVGPQGQAKWRVVLGGADSAPLGAEGGEVRDVGGRSSRRRGGEATSPEPSFNPEEPSNDQMRARVTAELWDHYQTTRPNGKRCKLGPPERRLIANALKVRDLDECKAAITGLFKSAYHVEGGYIDLKYALLGGGRSPAPAATIDRLATLARSNGHANGNGGGRLKDKLYGGRSWDELTRGEQEGVKEAASLDIDLSLPRPDPVPVVPSENGITSAWFAT